MGGLTSLPRSSKLKVCVTNRSSCSVVELLTDIDDHHRRRIPDWDDSETTAAQLTTSIKGKSDAQAGNAAGGAAGQSKTGTNALDSLWEDNWDDDDIEDDFSVQLR